MSGLQKQPDIITCVLIKSAGSIPQARFHTGNLATVDNKCVFDISAKIAPNFTNKTQYMPISLSMRNDLLGYDPMTTKDLEAHTL